MRNPRLRSAASTLALTLLAGVLLGGSGCATPGPNHTYATAHGSPDLHDLTAATAIPRLITASENVQGLAYDFNTDHLFLRLAPTQVIRVIERPSGKILREMPLAAELRTTHASADLAIRSSDRHLFAVHTDRRAVMELSLWGETLRRIDLAGVDAPIDGLAYDQLGRRLLALVAGTVRAYDTDGAELSRVPLAAPLHAVSLGYDSRGARFFVPLADTTSLGEFDATGQLVHTHPALAPRALTAIDAGERSLVRVF